MFSQYLLRLKGVLLSMDTVIWVMVMPFILATCFGVAFSGLDDGVDFAAFKIAVVDDANYRRNETFAAALESVSEGEDALFILHTADSAEEADELLKSGEIEGYILVGDDDRPSAAVKKSGLNQTVLKAFLDRYEQTGFRVETIIADITENDPQAAAGLTPEKLEALTGVDLRTKSISLTRNKPSMMSEFFYNLMATACLYGSFMGINMAVRMQGNLSAMGARRTVSALPRRKMVVTDILAVFTVHMVSLLLLLCYTSGWGADYGGNIPLIIAALALGSLLGITVGSAVGSAFPFKMGIKMLILVMVSMGSSLLSGLMIHGIDYVIRQRAPIVSKLNPAANIAGAFRSLYYYDSYGQYLRYMGVMGIMAGVFLFVTIFFVRRQKYASI